MREDKYLGQQFGNLIVIGDWENRAGEEVAVCYCTQCGQRVFDIPVEDLRSGWQHDCPKYDYYERIQQKFPTSVMDCGGHSLLILWDAPRGHYGSMEKVLEEVPGRVYEHNGAYMWKTKSGVWHCIGKTATAGMNRVYHTEFHDGESKTYKLGYDNVTELYFPF